MIFVFGSNEAGIHGAGAAHTAVRLHGAKYGQGVGMQGTSYGIPTKDFKIVSLPLERVAEYVADFIKFAQENRNIEFQITQIGCGLAGFTAAQIAPMFEDAPDNCFFDEAWRPWLPNKAFWGTYGK